MPMCDIIMEEQKEPDLMVNKEDLDFSAQLPDVVTESNPHNVSMEALPSSPGPLESSFQLTLPTVENAVPFGPELPPMSMPYSDVLAGELTPSPGVGVCGLHNIGNTCFLNAGLQCLFSNPLIVQYFLTDLQLSDGIEDTLAGKFAALLEKVWSGKYLVLHPADFKSTLAIYHPQFKDFRQEDCQEFLAILINSLNEQLNEASGQASSCLPPQPSSSALPPLPTIEDLYMKDTKATDCNENCIDFTQIENELDKLVESPESDPVLNTNVLAEDDEESKEMKVDSEKYHKQDNLEQQQQQQQQEQEETTEDEDELMLLATAKGDGGAESVVDKAGPSKPIKDTNLLANHKPHKAPELYAKKFLFSELSGDDDYSINNIKRMKIDDEEKNLRSRRQRQSNTSQATPTNTLPTIPCLPPATSDQIVNNTYCQNADKAWQTYLNEHPSVFVKTFQGQFKSTVVCQECHHMSVAYDPFMYLSVPIPHAMERQISVLFIPCDSRPPVRYLLIVHKQEKVQHLRMALLRHIEEENVDLVIAEVFNNHISRKLEDNILLKYVNDESRILYAFEMIPPPEIDDTTEPTTSTPPPCAASMSPNNLVSTPEPPPNNLLTSELTPNNLLGVEGPVPNNLQVVLPTIDPSSPNNILPDATPNNLQGTGSLSPGKQSADSGLSPSGIMKNLESSLDTSCFSSVDNDSISLDNLAPNSNSGDSAQNSVDDSMRIGISDDSMRNNMSTDSARNNVLSDSMKVNFSETSLRINVEDDSARNSASDDSPRNNTDDAQLRNNSMTGAMTTSMETSTPLTDSFIDNRSAWGTAGENNTSWDTAGNMTSPSGAQSDTQGPKVGTEDVKNDSGAGGEEGAGPSTDSWKSCAICLEDMMDFELMVHSSCGGMLCHACLEMSFKHYGGSFVCPVCSTSAKPEVDFIQMDVMADYKPKTRLLTVAVVQRYYKADGAGLQLFGHPNILYLPSQLTGEELYAMVDRVVPLLQNYTIVLTDGQGMSCSRCLYTSHCPGCEISRAGEVSLQPNDHLAITYSSPLSEQQMATADTCTDHSSMALLRKDTSLTIYDCFSAFTQSDILDEHNPWFCAQCNRNQCANKTMTVWRYPNTLVVYLKRFVFHDLVSSKVDKRVDFPLTGLDLSEYISGPTDDILLYDLISCVCHFGGVSSGHYTAYAKNCISGEWWYYNDDVTTKQAPTTDDHVNNAYVLFYQKQGSKVDLSIPSELRFLPKDLLNAAAAAAGATGGGGDQTIAQADPQTSSLPLHYPQLEKDFCGVENSSFSSTTWLPEFNQPAETDGSSSRLSCWLAASKPVEEADTCTGKADGEEQMDFYT